MQQQQWINSGLPGVWTEQQQQQQGVSSAHHHRTAQKQAGTIPGGLGISGARRRGADGWVLVWSWVLLGSLLLPGAWSFLSEEQEELIVELHNHYRGMVSPSASAMLPLRWDPSLKVIAEGYAAKCVWNHNPELEETGENLFANTGPLDLREVLEKWFFENLVYDYNNNSCPEDKMCGHYTQMVWADTHRVGCAWHLCNTMDGLDFERANFLVCNYYPAGNFDDERPYVEGEWCSSCPENLQKCENNLCVDDSVEEDEDEDDDDEGDAVTDEGGVTPLPATPPPATPESSPEAPPPATPESSPEASPNTPPPHPGAPGTQPPTSPYPPAPEGEEQELTEKELDQIASNKKGERAGESDKKREMETNREKEMTRISVMMKSDAASSLRSTVFQLVLVFLTVGLIVRE